MTKKERQREIADFPWQVLSHVGAELSVLGKGFHQLSPSAFRNRFPAAF
jgi:hypothetical protein